MTPVCSCASTAGFIPDVMHATYPTGCSYMFLMAQIAPGELHMISSVPDVCVSCISGSFAIREDTEVLGRRDDNHTGVFSIREDAQVLEDSVFSRRGPNATEAGDGAFAVREDTEVLNRTFGNHTCTGVFSVRDDTAVFGGGFTVREDTEVLSNLGLGGKARPPVQSGLLSEQQRSGSCGLLLGGGERFDSVRVLGPSVPQASGDLAALRAPSGHLRPTNRSGSLPLQEVGGMHVASLRGSQQLRESSARRKLQFGVVAPASGDGPPRIGMLAPKGVVSGELEGAAVQLDGGHRAASLLACASVELPEPEDFMVLESEDPQVRCLCVHGVYWKPCCCKHVGGNQKGWQMIAWKQILYTDSAHRMYIIATVQS
jgi:hypothetical protein